MHFQPSRRLAHPYRRSVSQTRLEHLCRRPVSHIRLAHPYRTHIRIADPSRRPVSNICIADPSRTSVSQTRLAHLYRTSVSQTGLAHLYRRPVSQGMGGVGVVTPEMLERRTRPGGVFDMMIKNKIGCNKTSLALIDYGVHFKKVRGWKDSEEFIGLDGKELVVNVFGEIAEGFLAHPAGSYPTYGEDGAIGDNQRPKFQLPLQEPTSCPPKLKAIYHNTLSTLQDVIHRDYETTGQSKTKSWLGSSQDNGDIDRVYVTSPSLFKASPDYRADNIKVKVDIDGINNSANRSASSSTCK
ncbi:hypothetical protein F5878DRAFT_662845 [Lentinula raphanica]|uniref:Uncharacterized protein n=1 Tax=Lentinula raphanica TaxID=153919 RepID=A0AA38P5A6_9AGAR|nr:hypothetical protein F5878DRAFT_662845 [Lentinula raphanica]